MIIYKQNIILIYGFIGCSCICVPKHDLMHALGPSGLPISKHEEFDVYVLQLSHVPLPGANRKLQK